MALLDLVHHETINALSLPKSFDNSSISPYIDYDFADGVAPVATPPSISITSPANNATVSSTIQLTINATSSVGIASVELSCDSTALSTDTTAPYLFSVNTTQLANGTHQFTATVTDTSGQTSQADLTLHVQNTAHPKPPHHHHK